MLRSSRISCAYIKCPFYLPTIFETKSKREDENAKCTRSFHGTPCTEMWQRVVGASLVLGIGTHYMSRAWRRLSDDMKEETRQKDTGYENPRSISHYLGLDLGTSAFQVSELIKGSTNSKPHMMESATGLYHVPARWSLSLDGKQHWGEMTWKQPRNTWIQNVPQLLQLNTARLTDPDWTPLLENMPLKAHVKKKKDDEDVEVIEFVSEVEERFSAQWMVDRMLEHAVENTVRHKVETLKGYGVVVTHPPSYSIEEQGNLLLAAQRAEVHILDLAPEPVAALHAFQKYSEAFPIATGKQQRFIVIDIGGLSTTVSMVGLYQNKWTVEQTRSTRRCSGEGINTALLMNIINEFRLKHGVDLTQDSIAMIRLSESIEAAKIELSSKNATQLSLPFISGNMKGPIHLENVLQRSLINRFVEDQLHAVETILEQVLHASDTLISNVDAIVLCGGGFRSPHASSALKSRINSTVFLEAPDLNPEEAVSQGASLMAQSYCNE